MKQHKEYEEALEKLKNLLPPVKEYSDEYWERNKIITKLWCCIYREEKARKAIEVLIKPEYLQLIVDKFKSEDKPSYEQHIKEVALREAFSPYWRTDMSITKLLEIRDTYKLSDLDLECLLTIDDFIEHIECGGIMSCDGQGEFVLNKKKKVPVRDFTVEECKKMQKKGCEYVLWYNK